ncbi:MAG TPA: nitrous oxide-stimulated promoter family protein [bacterium]|nr:nitrous oxide-stimulated promoter family protein [bacterium]
MNRRIKREKATIKAMIRIYCRAKHSSKTGLCASCEALLGYSMGRIGLCPFIDDKPTCVKCPVHCYTKTRREEVREVMRFSGPRMIYKHPVLAVLHIMDSHKKKKNIKPE